MRLEEGTQTVRLDRGRILEAAERIVGSEGVRALTMRRIGSALGADPTAVYRHFRNKEALLTRLAERMFATEPELDPDDPWQEQLRVHIRHAFGRYRAHPDLGILLARQPDDLRPLVRICEQTLDLLVDGAGLPLNQASEFSHLIENHVVGCGLFFAISDYRDPRITDRDAMRRAYALLPAAEFPRASSAAPFLFPDPDDMFERMT
ncbi:MAG: TetR/AcrR family transcriptional regulator, partial [Solirubrobacteraceae bacterium]